MYHRVLFDLDGTIMDPREGFIGCIRYALRELDCPDPGAEHISGMIGPPLQSTFEKLLRSNDTDLINEAVDLYRKRYADVGIYENQVYPGIVELLGYLRDSSCSIGIVTFKPTKWTEIIVKHFSLDRYVSGVFGPALDERLHDKLKLVESALSGYPGESSKTLIIGDRKEDIAAGKANGIDTLGVTYGYGSREEITAADPDYICSDTAEIRKVLEEHE